MEDTNLEEQATGELEIDFSDFSEELSASEFIIESDDEITTKPWYIYTCHFPVHWCNNKEELDFGPESCNEQNNWKYHEREMKNGVTEYFITKECHLVILPVVPYVLSIDVRVPECVETKEDLEAAIVLTKIEEIRGVMNHEEVQDSCLVSLWRMIESKWSMLRIKLN